MARKQTELMAVTDRATRAWHALERKQRRALETALQAKREMEQIEAIIELAQGRRTKAA